MIAMLPTCTVIPVPGCYPIYSFSGFNITRVDATFWAVLGLKNSLRFHLLERLSEVGFTGGWLGDGAQRAVFFRSPTQSITGTLILATKITEDVIGSADAYVEPWIGSELGHA